MSDVKLVSHIWRKNKILWYADKIEENITFLSEQLLTSIKGHQILYIHSDIEGHILSNKVKQICKTNYN